MIFTNSKGIKYYLHKRISILDRNHIEVATYFFRKEKKEDYVGELPVTLRVSETKTGLPVVKHL